MTYILWTSVSGNVLTVNLYSYFSYYNVGDIIPTTISMGYETKTTYTEQTRVCYKRHIIL